MNARKDVDSLALLQVFCQFTIGWPYNMMMSLIMVGLLNGVIVVSYELLCNGT